jgi:hypothetical protein
LDARIGGTEQVAAELVLLIIVARRLAEGGEFEVDIAYEFAVVICFHKISRK